MTIVVLDANVLASGILENSNPPALVIDAWIRADFELVVSGHLVNELRRTLDKPYFQRRIAPERVQRVLAALANRATRVEPQPMMYPVATHPEDDLILTTAVAGQADYLVTGDQQLLALGTYQGVRIVSPAAFLALLDAGDTDDQLKSFQVSGVRPATKMT